MIHETIDPKHRGRGDTKKLKDDIRSVVLCKIEGRDNAKTSGEIARMVGVEESDTNVKIRTAMKELLVEDRIPVISCTDGFFLAITNEEISDYRESMVARVRGINRDIQALDAINLVQRSLL